MSLRWRLFVAMLAALALTLALVIAIGAVLTRQQVDRSQASGLARSADQLAAQRRGNVNYSTEKHTTAGGVLLWVARRPAFDGLVPDVDRSSDGQTDYQGKRQLYSYRTIPHLGLLVLRPASARSAAWRPFLTDLLLAALAGVALAAVLSFAIARSITRPIRRVAEATRRIAAEKRHEPLPREGAAELTALAEAFDQMAVELAASRDAERAFLLSVSHELKTPLTAIRGWAEGLAEGAFEPEDAARTITLEAGRLERLVRDLLDLARMNRSEFSVRTEPVDLAEVAREAVRRHEASARGFEVELSADANESWVSADADRLLQVVSNLVENALRETPSGGTVTVIVRDARVVVADTGPGIPPEDVSRAFERFYLYDKFGKERPVGSGLGLAIVQQLVTAMGGEVSVASDETGTRFSVALRPEVRGVDDLEVGARQAAERV
jgi:two-component system sensor histidine kinase BaeS